MSAKPSIAIVSPATAEANNGNWRTAQRWAQLLTGTGTVRVLQAWPDAAANGDNVLLALHARRSAESIRAWHGARGARGLAVVLTGTDLYGDLAHDAASQASLAMASRLVVLQDEAMRDLPQIHRGKARVINQSTQTLPAAAKPDAEFTAVMVGHLREVKSPRTYFDAARLLGSRPGLRLLHVGAADDEAWSALARATEADAPVYRWLGALPHDETREVIRRAHVLVHPSAAEGGAHVIMEAVCSGTPVLASRIAGNIGMLGPAYEGYFEPGDAAGLAGLLSRLAEDPAGPLMARLRAQCALRAPLFAPEAEQAALRRLIDELQETP
jgi:putative glycosyltransferase (TIGR04348 family)